MVRTQQATALELLEARYLNDDWQIPEPEISINYDALKDWLWRPRHSHGPRLLQTCAHCHDYPVSGVEWRPPHPLWPLLCSRCRCTVYTMAARIADHRKRRLVEVINAIMAVLELAEPS